MLFDFYSATWFYRITFLCQHYNNKFQNYIKLWYGVYARKAKEPQVRAFLELPAGVEAAWIAVVGRPAEKEGHGKAGPSRVCAGRPAVCAVMTRGGVAARLLLFLLYMASSVLCLH